VKTQLQLATPAKRAHKKHSVAELHAAIDRADRDLARALAGYSMDDRALATSARSRRAAARRELQQLQQPNLL